MLSVGVGTVLFPHAADWFVTRAQAGEVVQHTQSLSGLNQGQIDWMFEGARTHNRDLAAGRAGFTSHHNPDYLALLSPQGSNIMATVSMPSLSLTVPIFHGTTDDVLYRGAGHQYGTSLPVGGQDTHSVVTAHSGLMRARLFTDLEQLGIGDQFFITTLGHQLWYQVDRIVIVEPGYYHEYLAIIPGRDLVTLFTCTPTGANTHRLLVRGTRIPTPSFADMHSAETMLDAGFPWWAAILAATVAGAATSGKMLLIRPAVAAGAKRSSEMERLTAPADPADGSGTLTSSAPDASAREATARGRHVAAAMKKGRGAA
jgi:sortase A